MDVVNQGSTYVLGLEFTDENGNAVTPSSSRYRVDVAGGNAVSGNANNAWVPFAPGGNTYDLEITAALNAMANNSVSREERVVTVEFKYSADNKTHETEYRYMLQRLENLLDVP